MSLRDELGPKVAAIKQLVDGWVAHMRELGGPGVQQDAPPDQLPLDESAFLYTGHNLDAISDAVDTLVSRFEWFYQLDTVSFRLAVMLLHGNVGIPADGDEPGVTDLRPTDGSACNRLFLAENTWVDQVDALLGLHFRNDEAVGDIWCGDGARAFYNGFLVPFHEASLKQQASTTGLASAAQLCERASQAAQRDIVAIADSAFAQLNRQIGDDNGDGNIWSVISHLATIAQFVIPDPEDLLGLLAYHAGLAAGAGEVEEPALPSYSAQASGRPVDLTVQGTFVEEIINSTYDNIVVLEELIADEDYRIRKGLEEYADIGGLRVARPDLADDDTLGGLAGEDVVADIVNIYQAGCRNLPGAANEYDRAARKLDACFGLDSLVAYFPRSWPLLGQVRDDLSDACRSISGSLSDAGATLVDIATEYKFTDDRNREQFERDRADILPPPGTQVPVRMGGHF